MRIDVNSGLVNGVYAILQLFIIIGITHYTRLIVGTLNIYKLHDCKRQVRFVTFSMGGLFDLGFSTPCILGSSACICATVIALTTAGAFSIIGSTEPKFEVVEVNSLVRSVSPGEEPFPFEKHISLENDRVSSAIPLLMRHPFCTKSTLVKHYVYQYESNLTDVTGMHLDDVESVRKHPISTETTCITSISGFSTQIALSFNQLHPSATFVKEFKESCLIFWDLPALPYFNVSAVSPRQGRNCRFPVLEGLCVKTRTARSYCVLLYRVPTGFTVVEYSTQPGWVAYDTCLYFRIKKRPESRQLKSILLLKAADVEPLYTACDRFLMTHLKVESNAKVTRRTGELSYVEINMLFLCLTTGLAAFITVCTGLVALALWFKILVVPKRLDYNRFNSSYDLLCHAASCAFGDEDRKICHIREIAVGVSKRVPHVGPLSESDLEGRQMFEEEELVGRGD